MHASIGHAVADAAPVVHPAPVEAARRGGGTGEHSAHLL
jgi:hypothetical protein